MERVNHVEHENEYRSREREREREGEEWKTLSSKASEKSACRVKPVEESKVIKRKKMELNKDNSDKDMGRKG